MLTLTLNFMVIFLILLGSHAPNLSATGLQVSVTGDLVYEQSISDESSAGDKLSLRGAELMFFAPLDRRFDGVVSAAAHDESGKVNFEIHEMYVSSSKLIPRSNFRFGQFFLGIGRLNRLHQHDWSFTNAPKVQRDFLSGEGALDSGLEYIYYLPTAIPFELTAGVTSGFKFGHLHIDGPHPLAPTHYARLSGFFPLSSTDALQLGINYLGRKDSKKKLMQLMGYDLKAKWRASKFVRLLLQSEGWLRRQETASGEVSYQAGVYLFGEYGLSQLHSVGLRVDGFKDLSKVHAITDKNINQIFYGFAGQWTFHSSELTKIRASVTHEMEIEEGVQTISDTRFDLQVIFTMGSHPAHKF